MMALSSPIIAVAPSRGPYTFSAGRRVLGVTMSFAPLTKPGLPGGSAVVARRLVYSHTNTHGV